MKPYDLSVVMPVYNEAEAIGPVLGKWVAMLDTLGIRYRIRAYNDGSKDATGAILAAAAEASGGKILAVDKPNSGHGPTILRGYREAAEDSDWVFQIDSDDEMGPEAFPALWPRREGYDFLVGRRDGRRQPLSRKLVSLVSRLCVRIFYGKGIWDVNTPYRLMRAEVFAPFFAQIPAGTFAPNVILSGLAARHRLRLLEVPVPQHDRTTGEVSIKKWKLLKAAARSFAQTVDFSCGGYGVSIALAYAVFAVCAGVWVVWKVMFNDDAYNIHVVQLMAKGLYPLVDFHCMYTQAVYWMLLPIKLLLGGWFGALVFHGVIVCLVAAVAALTWRVARAFGLSRALAHGAALSVLVFSMTQYGPFSPWCALWGTLALATFFLARSPWRLLGCGAFVALAYLSKQNALVWGGVLGWAVIFFERGLCGKIRAAVLLALGVVAMVGLYLLFLRAMDGSWVAATTLLGDSDYHHATRNLRPTVELIARLSLCVLPAFAAAPFLVGELRRRLLFLALASLTILPVLFVSPYLHNLVIGGSVFALYLAALVQALGTLGKGAIGLLIWGGAAIPMALGLLLDTGIGVSGALLKRGGQGRVLPEVSRILAQFNDDPTERLFVFPLEPKRGMIYPHFLYVESDLVPANLVVRHNDNLFWGTEKLGRDDALIRQALETATLIVVQREQEKRFRAFWPSAAALRPVAEAEGFTVYRKPRPGVE